MLPAKHLPDHTEPTKMIKCDWVYALHTCLLKPRYHSIQLRLPSPDLVLLCFEIPPREISLSWGWEILRMWRTWAVRMSWSYANLFLHWSLLYPPSSKKLNLHISPRRLGFYYITPWDSQHGWHQKQGGAAGSMHLALHWLHYQGYDPDKSANISPPLSDIGLLWHMCFMT